MRRIESDIPDEKPVNFYIAMPTSTPVDNLRHFRASRQKSRREKFLHMYGAETDALFENAAKFELPKKQAKLKKEKWRTYTMSEKKFG